MPKSVTKKLLSDYQEAKDALAKAKEKEIGLRTTICTLILKDKQKGVEHFKKFGLDAAATAKMNQKIDAEILRSIFKDLNPDEKACIKYKPELVAKKYKLLPPDSIFHKAVESKPGTPSLTVKEIKE